jgi:hypothetical protein
LANFRDGATVHNLPGLGIEIQGKRQRPEEDHPACGMKVEYFEKGMRAVQFVGTFVEERDSE